MTLKILSRLFLNKQINYLLTTFTKTLQVCNLVLPILRIDFISLYFCSELLLKEKVKIPNFY